MAVSGNFVLTCGFGCVTETALTRINRRLGRKRSRLAVATAVRNLSIDRQVEIITVGGRLCVEAPTKAECDAAREAGKARRAAWVAKAEAVGQGSRLASLAEAEAQHGRAARNRRRRLRKQINAAIDGAKAAQ